MKHGKCVLFACAALAAAWLFVPPASAQPSPDAQANQPASAQPPAPRGNPCKDDVKKLCPDAKSFGDRMKCMKEHEADLSEACKQARAIAAKRRASAKPAGPARTTTTDLVRTSTHTKTASSPALP